MTPREIDALVAEKVTNAVEAEKRVAELEAALREIEAGSPPDDWQPYNSWGDPVGYPGLVDEVDISNSGDIESHAYAVGAWEAAKKARAALKGGGQA